MGSNVTFTSVADGYPDPIYQWRRHGNSDLNSVTNIAGATNANLTLSNATTNDTGYYSAVASNNVGTATSRTAHLEVYNTQRGLISAWSYVSNRFQFTVSGITGALYRVQLSTNLVDWSPVHTNQTTFTYTDSSVTNAPNRFYRILYQP